MKNEKRRAFLPFLFYLFFCLVSCSRINQAANAPEETQTGYASAVRLGAWPLAILKPGEQPLWFQLTEDGPVLLESIEDAMNTAAFVPWPLALYMRFFLERGEELLLAVNRDGFMKFAPYYDNVTGIAMYRFTGGEFWRKYTIGGFVFFDDKPLAVLYLDDRFLDTDSAFPQPRAWTFNMESNWPFPLDVPALQKFPADEGWDIDALRKGDDGHLYYRAARRRGSSPTVRMLRTDDLSQAGEDVSQDAFFNSAPRVAEIDNSSLPPLPKGFVYTGIGHAGDSLIVLWEEQEDFNIGAAGFMVIKR